MKHTEHNILSCQHDVSVARDAMLVRHGVVVSVRPYVTIRYSIDTTDCRLGWFRHRHISHTVLARNPRTDTSRVTIIFAPPRQGWWRGSVVERRSLAGELSLSCARPAADG